MFKKAAIVYCSPGGTTRHVAQVIEKQLENAGISVLTADLGKGNDGSFVIDEVKKGETCLFIGSPVYVNHPLPPVQQFISNLSEITNVCTVPFVTWGGATSGIALYDMGKALTDKGFSLIGAGKILALHSMMQQSENPLGSGHPDKEDDNLIQDLVNSVLKKMAEEAPEAIALSDLAYQPEKVHAEMEKMTLETARGHLPKKEINEALCTECRVCSETCPVQAITLSPYPEFGKNCICCFQCMRACPEGAIEADLSPMEDRIKGKAKQFDEHPLTQIFV
ncbi:MAG: EFR1 family ferrodoxin [Desulfobacterales bacterium]|nr:EFR1 family ferrodoxin [Desulfobacterales bacterium]